jgi:hypothetical protein
MAAGGHGVGGASGGWLLQQLIFKKARLKARLFRGGKDVRFYRKDAEGERNETSMRHHASQAGNEFSEVS